ncbi:uncharacterized protein TNCV_4224701 [Trichonephila clavipes]|nr:uncharacterized protein TNCV_4224701 [Trichonephila clavipes]
MTESPHVTTCPDTKMTRIGTGDEKKVILNVNRRRSPDTSALTSIMSSKYEHKNMNEIINKAARVAQLNSQKKGLPVKIKGFTNCATSTLHVEIVGCASRRGTLAHNPRCSRRRRIDEADISRPVAVDQSDSNCLEKAVRSLTTMRSRCRSLCASVTFFGSLPVVQFVRCSLDKCFHIRLTVELFR